jgi:hypothetical protein
MVGKGTVPMCDLAPLGFPVRQEVHPKYRKEFTMLRHAKAD